MPMFLAALSTTLILGAARQEPDKNGFIKPVVQVQKEDYAVARSKFTTHLIDAKREPDDPNPLVLPKGAQEIEFTSGTLKLKAWINPPRAESKDKRQAVLFLHGGFSFGLPDWEMTKPYRDAGFIVMVPMLRGENGLAGTPSLFYNEIDDVNAAADYLAKQPFIDAKHIHLAGHSVGGTLTMLAAMSSNRFSSAVSFSGSPDQVIFCKFGIDPKEIPFDTKDQREVQMRSPLAYATSFKCPVRLYYGTNEPHFHLSTQETAKIARKSRLDVQAIQIQGGHFSAIPEAMGASIGFFHKH